MAIHGNGKHLQPLFIDVFKMNRSTKDDFVYQATLDLTTFVKKEES